jgi:hypothetical protein
MGWIRSGDRLELIEDDRDWVSPRLGIRFSLQPETLIIYRPDERPFLSCVEIDKLRQQAQQQAEQSDRRAEQAEQRSEKLAAKLRELGIDPNNL